MPVAETSVLLPSQCVHRAVFSYMSKHYLLLLLLLYYYYFITLLGPYLRQGSYVLPLLICLLAG